MRETPRSECLKKADPETFAAATNELQIDDEADYNLGGRVEAVADPSVEDDFEAVLASLAAEHPDD